MVEQEKILTRGGIYLARLDPAKGEEIGKIRVKLQKRGKSELEPQISVNFFSVVKSILQ